MPWSVFRFPVTKFRVTGAIFTIGSAIFLLLLFFSALAAVITTLAPLAQERLGLALGALAFQNVSPRNAS
jgi:hypothetical protein